MNGLLVGNGGRFAVVVLCGLMAAVEARGAGTNAVAPPEAEQVEHTAPDAAAAPHEIERRPVSPEAPKGDSHAWRTETHPSQEAGWTTIADGYGKMHEFFGDRIHVGVRSMKYEFRQSMTRVGQGSENYFLGSIDELQDIQDTSWDRMTYGVYVCRNLGLEYRRDEVRARALTDSDDNHSDGVFVVKGRVLSLVARLPLDQVLHATRYAFDWPSYSEGWEYDLLARFIPYVGINFDRLVGSFEAETWWAHGYAGPASWEELGSPPDTIRNGHVRELRVVNSEIGRYAMYGISIRVFDHFYLDMNRSSVDAELAIDYYLDRRYMASGTIPMDYESKSVGIRYFF